jgi:hypothetical protein
MKEEKSGEVENKKNWQTPPTHLFGSSVENENCAEYRMKNCEGLALLFHSLTYIVYFNVM